MFRDLNGLSIWMAISSFWGKLQNEAVQEHFKSSLLRS
jgi:hypothetical protein